MASITKLYVTKTYNCSSVNDLQKKPTKQYDLTLLNKEGSALCPTCKPARKVQIWIEHLAYYS